MRSQARYGALLVRISDPLSRILHRTRGGGNATVVQHVRVIPERLLNFGSHKVIVYGYFSVVKHKAVTFSAFVNFVSVSVQIGMGEVSKDSNTTGENVKVVT